MWTILLLTAAHGQSRPNLQYEQVSATLPIKVHWGRTQDEALALDALAAAELAWTVQVDQLGFNAPVLPDGFDGDELDIYLIQLGYGQAWASPDVYAPYVDHTPGDGLNSTPCYIAIDRNLPANLIDPFVVHEFNHVLHYATDFHEASLNVWEATATASQTWTLGVDGAWDADVADYQSDPYVNSLTGDSYYTWYQLGVGFFYEYGAALWVMHLDQVVGSGDGTAGAALWDALAQEGSVNEPDVLDAFVQLSGETELGPALNGLARSRFLVGSDWDARGIPDAEFWDVAAKVPATAVSGDLLPLDNAVQPPLMPTGMAFYDLDPTGIDPSILHPALRVEVTSASGLDSAVLALWWADDGTVGEIGGHGGDPVIEVPLEDIARVVVAVSNLHEPGWDPDDGGTYVDGDQRLALSLIEGSETGPTTTPPGTTTTPPGTTPGTTEPAPEGMDRAKAADGGCGCTHSPTLGMWWLLPLAGALGRRTTESRPGCRPCPSGGSRSSTAAGSRRTS